MIEVVAKEKLKNKNNKMESQEIKKGKRQTTPMICKSKSFSYTRNCKVNILDNTNNNKHYRLPEEHPKKKKPTGEGGRLQGWFLKQYLIYG